MIRGPRKIIIQERAAFSLVEVVVTIGVLAVVALGALSYQFHAVKQVKRAGVKMSATRLGMLVLENWKIQGGAEHYDPTVLDPTATELPSHADIYVFEVDGVSFYLDLSAENVQSSEETGVTLRELTVSVQWNPDYQEGLPDSDDPVSTFNTFVRCDQSGG